MKKLNLLFITLTSMIIFISCSSKTKYIGENSTLAPVTMGLDRQDFEKAASDMTSSLLQSGALHKKDDKKYVVMISDIVNDTTQRINTKMLTKKIRIAMLKSGKAILTTAVGTQRDDRAQDVRKLRGNKEFKQSTIAKKASLYAPELSLSGDIFQKTAKTDDGKQLVEYYFQMTLTHIESGLAYWEDEVIVGKLGKNNSVVW